MSLGENIELSLAQALRKELAGWAKEHGITSLSHDAALEKTKVALRALPDTTLIGADAASVFLGVGTRTLRKLEEESDVYEPDTRVGVSDEKRYSVGRLRKMLDALDERTERKLGEARRRRAKPATQGRVVEKTYGSLEDFNRDMAAGLNAEGRITSIVVSVHVPGFQTVGPDHFVVDGIHELLTDYVWEDPDLLLTWQNAYRRVIGELLTDGLVEAHAASSSARLTRTFGDGTGGQL